MSPVDPKSPDPDPSVEPHRDAESSGPDSATILLVEDDSSIRNLLQRVLVGAGYEVLAPLDPHEALDLWRNHRDRIALVVTDLIMPGMSGRELAARMAETGTRPPLLFITGFATPETETGAGEGGIPVLHKPFPPSAFLEAVRRLLEGEPG